MDFAEALPGAVSVHPYTSLDDETLRVFFADQTLTMLKSFLDEAVPI